MSSSGHSTNTTISTSTSSTGSSAVSMDDFRVYPAPPPTVNRLSSRQKAQLRRSTTKLARLLGEAPQVVDEMPSRIGSSTTKMGVSTSRKLQPSLSIMSHAPGTARVARSASLRRKVDPELYPLSSTLRPASCDVVRSRTRGAAVSRTSSESKKSSSSRRRSSSISSEFLMNENVNASVIENDEKGYSSFVVVSRSARVGRQHRARPDSMVSRKSRDSLCDSVLDFEPSFYVPSATKMKREKMARVCKLLGEDVPVHLVFPVSRSDDLAEGFSSSSPSSSSSSSSSSDSDLDSELVLDICALPPPPPTPLKEIQSQIQNQTQIETQTRIVSPPPPPPLPPKNNIKRKPVPKAYFDDEKDLENADVEAPLPPLPTKAELKQEEQEQEQEQEGTRWQPTLAPTPSLTSSLPMTYRASRPNLGLRLETIVEQSPRTSYCPSSASSVDRRSSRSSTSSSYSLLSTTTSSSYRFTSSGCLSSPSDCSAPTSSGAHAHAHAHAHAYGVESSTPASPRTAAGGSTSPSANVVQQQIHAMSSSPGTHGRREFAIYAPFRRRPSALANSCQAQFVSANNPNRGMSTGHEHDELVRGMLDLRV